MSFSWKMHIIINRFLEYKFEKKQQDDRVCMAISGYDLINAP